MSATGQWKLLIKTPMGEQKIEADLVEDGSVLSGTMHDDSHPVAPIKGAHSADGRLSWKFDAKKPFPMTLAFDMAVDGDTMIGTCKAGVFPTAPVTGQRG